MAAKDLVQPEAHLRYTRIVGRKGEHSRLGEPNGNEHLNDSKALFQGIRAFGRREAR